MNLRARVEAGVSDISDVSHIRIGSWRSRAGMGWMQGWVTVWGGRVMAGALTTTAATVAAATACKSTILCLLHQTKTSSVGQG